MAEATKTLSAPTSITLMITRRCNLHCLHCGSSPEQFLREDMSTKEILAVIDELARCKVFRVALSGGEPLLHPDFYPIVEAIMQRPLRMALFTNATLVTEQVAKYLKGLRRPPFISVSFDAMTSETHDRIRGVDSCARTRRGIELLTAAGLRVRPFVVMSRINYHELPKIVAFAKSLGIRRVFATPPSPCGRATEHAAEMILRPEELREVLETVLAVIDSNGELLSGPWAHLACLYREQKEGPKSSSGTSQPRTFWGCSAGLTTATIACDGTVVPCDMAYTYRAGNVQDDSLANIWRNSPAFRAIREARGIPLAQVSGCGSCTWQHTCRGPCGASGYTTTGTWPAAPTVCMTKEICDLFGTASAVRENGRT